MPDGKELVISADFDRSGSFSLYRIRADGSGEPRRLTSGAKLEIAGSVSPDGKWLLFASQTKAGAKMQLRQLDLQTPGAVSTPFGTTETEEFMPDFSPDGRWVATVTNIPKIAPQRKLFEGPFFPSPFAGRVWDLHPDGKRLLLATFAEKQPRGRAVDIVLNWDGTLPVKQ